MPRPSKRREIPKGDFIKFSASEIKIPKRISSLIPLVQSRASS
jgi:hypothetical protein